MKLFLIAILAISSLALASSSETYDEGNLNSFSYEPLSIDGEYSQQRQTDSERMKQIRAQLEKKNEMIIKQKIEAIRLRRELLLEQRIQQMFAKNT